MEDDHRNREAVRLLEEGWFFGNSLKISRSNSDPTTSSIEEEEKKNGMKTSSLLRAPSLPSRFGKREEYSDEEDEKYGPRMGYLIRQAMPCKLSRAPSLPPVQDVLSRGPTLSKLTRRSSLNIPSKHTSKDLEKGTKILSSSSTSKDLHERRQELGKSRNLQRSISLKTLTDKEVQGFQDLGFTFDKEDLSPSVVDKLARLNIKDEIIKEDGKRNPSLSEAWNETQTKWSYSPPVPRWIDTKSSSEDMKAQIKSWARAVASNVHQEC